jgi:hypothetical protein
VSLLKLTRVPLFPLIVVREKLARGDRPRDPEPMVMDEPQAVAEYDQIGASVQSPPISSARWASVVCCRTAER